MTREPNTSALLPLCRKPSSIPGLSCSPHSPLQIDMTRTRKSGFQFFSKPKFLMASLISLSLLSFLLYLSLTSAAKHHIPRRTPADQIPQACEATRYPDSCRASLQNKAAGDATALQIIQAAMGVSAADLLSAKSMIANILAASSGNVNRTGAAKNCAELLRLSEYRLSASKDDLLTRGRIKDARAWTSAALAFQYDCWSALKYVNDTAAVDRTMAFLNDNLIAHTSNALAMMLSYDLRGADTKLWIPPATERQGSFEAAGAASEFDGGMEDRMKSDATVCRSGCDYAKVQDAVDAAPENRTTGRFVIFIKEGTYDEIVRVPLEKQNVVFLGQGMGKTVITGSLYSGMPGITTYNTATVGVQGDGFMARGITFQNIAQPNPKTHQAVAFRSDSDRSLIQECEFIGSQDTLYPHTLRQFYKSCRIQGNVDFIFGNSAAVFQNCLILVSPRQLRPEKGESNAVTAHGRIDPSQSAGFVFQNCIINGTEAYIKLYNSKPKAHKNYLGRPWKEYSRVVFIRCQLEALITPQGWMPWSGDFALKTLYYGEFENSGPGSNMAARVGWSSTIPADHVASYSVKNFIQGDEWIPSRAQ